MAVTQEELQGLPWRVYRLNDCDWWVARSLPEAMGSYLIETQMSCTEAFDGERELTLADLDRLRFIDEDGERRSFRAELERRVAAGLEAPEMFASTET